jgi:hypothetical protein
MSTLARSGLRPRIEGEFEGLLTTWTLVEQGRGWTLGSRLLRDDPPPGVCAVPLVDVSFPWGFDLLLRKDESRACVLDIAELAHAVASTFSRPFPAARVASLLKSPKRTASAR